MNVFDAIRNRRSIRVYAKRSIEAEKLSRVLEAGRLAPSARNIQEWKFVVVTDKDTRLRLMEAARNQQFVGQAPVIIVGCATITDYVMSCGQVAYPVDLAIAMTQMTLQAVEEGLGTCWVCAFDESQVKSVLGIPTHVRVVALLPIGYPGETPVPRARKDMSQLICYEKFAT